jgi:hypothetical protein
LLDQCDGTGWDSEYQRDTWLLRRLGVAGHDGARLDFAAVQLLWLRELTNGGVAGGYRMVSGCSSCARAALALPLYPFNHAVRQADSELPESAHHSDGGSQ